MRKSENFDLNLYEGTDIFNPLTTEVQNYEKIDAQMKKNYNLSVGKATELKTGTVHALTRENADCPMMHFTATSNFTSNDTFTVDGVQVSALLVDGSTLPTNCYIIGSEVICYLKGTLLTFFLSGSISKDSEKLGGELPSYYSKQEDFEQLETKVNSMSGIVEKNSNDIVDLNESTTWKELYSGINKVVNLPSGWKEIIFVVSLNNGDTKTITYIDRGSVPSDKSACYFQDGYYSDASNYARVNIQCSVNSVTLASAWYNSKSNVASSRNIGVRYR